VDDEHEGKKKREIMRHEWWEEDQLEGEKPLRSEHKVDFEKIE